jgi:hypothetical protein
MEQREVRAGIKSSHLISKFKNSFRYITATFHPSDIPGESTGKSSNLSWAARAASERYGPEIRKDVIITSIDGKSKKFRPVFRLSRLPSSAATIGLSVLCH